MAKVPTVVYVAGPMSGYHNFNYDAFDEAVRIIRKQADDYGLNLRVINPADNFERRQNLPYNRYLERALEQVSCADVVVLLKGWQDSKGANREVEYALKLNKRVIPFEEYAGMPSPQNDPDPRAQLDPLAPLPQSDMDEDPLLKEAVEGALFGPHWYEPCDCGSSDCPQLQSCTGDAPPAIDKFRQQESMPFWECDCVDDENCVQCADREDWLVVPDRRITDEAWDLVVQGDRQSSYGHPEQDFRTTGRAWGALIENWLVSEGLWCCREGDLPSTRVPDIPPRIVALMMAALKASRESQQPKRDNRVDGIGYWLCADRIEEGY